MDTQLRKQVDQLTRDLDHSRSANVNLNTAVRDLRGEVDTVTTEREELRGQVDRLKYLLSKAERDSANLAEDLLASRQIVQNKAQETLAAEQEYADLVARVLEVAAAYGERYNLCEQLEGALDEIGILPEDTIYEATVITHHAVQVTVPWRKSIVGLDSNDVRLGVNPSDLTVTDYDAEVEITGGSLIEYFVTDIEEQ